MLSKSILQNFTWQDLKYLDTETLFSPDGIDWLNMVEQDPMFELEPGKAKEFYDSVIDLIGRNVGINGAPEDLRPALVRLRWKSLPASTSKEKFGLLSNNVIYSLACGVDIVAELEKILGVFEYNLGPEEKQRAEWVYELENNQEDLGINLGAAGEENGSRLNIKNLLVFYNQSAPIGKKRGSFEKINFLKSNAYLKKLNSDQAVVIEQIMRIYDWLLFPPAGPLVINEEQTQIKYSNIQKFNFNPNFSQKTPPISTPGPTTKVDLNEILGQGSGVRMSGQVENSGTETKKSLELPKIKLPPITPLKKPLPKLINMSDMVNSGNKPDHQGQDLGLIRQEIETKKRQAQAMIEKKLEDLKKRKS